MDIEQYNIYIYIYFNILCNHLKDLELLNAVNKLNMQYNSENLSLTSVLFMSMSAATAHTSSQAIATMKKCLAV